MPQTSENRSLMKQVAMLLYKQIRMVRMLFSIGQTEKRDAGIPRNSFLGLRMPAVVLFLILTLGAGETIAQTLGDYRSATTGNWNALATWQWYNGTAWVTPTSAQGYPGQNSGTGAVTIQTGHVVTVGTVGITTQPFGSLTIQNGAQLYLTGSNSTITFSFSTKIVDIITGGSIFFFKKSKFLLIADAVTLTRGANSLLSDVCNNNAEFWIGSQKYAVCAGAPGDIFTFNQFIAAGGTLNAIPTSNSPLCTGGTISLTGNYGGATGPTLSYAWSVTAPGGGVSTYNTKDVTIPSAVTGTYSARLTVTSTLGGTTYTNSETIPILVNPLPTLTGALQAVTVCDGSAATINLTGLVPSNTFEAYYTIDGGSVQTAPNLTSSSTGTSSFTTIPLSAANNGKTLRITGIKITNPTTNCTQSFTQDVTLSVWTTGPGTWIGQVNSDWNTAGNWCSGIPTLTTDVFIPPLSASVPNQPVIGTAGGLCKDITISNGASLTISGSNALDVYGNWVNNGTFTPNTGTVSFVGSGVQQTIGGSGTNTFNHLTINQTGTVGGVIAGSDITVKGVLNLQSANPASGMVGALEMVTDYNGYPATNSTYSTQITNPIDSYILTMGPNATTIGPGDVTGKIYRNSLQANTAYTFGSQYTTYAYTVAPTDVMVTVTIGTAHGQTGVWGDPLSVKRSYEMVPTGGDGGRVTMNLRYLESELNGNPEQELVTGDYDIGPEGNPQGDEHGRSSYNFDDNYIGLSGVPIFYFKTNDSDHKWRTVFNLHKFYTGTTVWDGSESTVWLLSTNWSNGAPGELMTAIIPDASTTPNDPILPDNNRIIGGIRILSGGILNLDGKTITVAGYNYNGWEDQSGLSNYAGSTVILTNSSSTDPGHPWPIPVSGVPNFYNLTINSNTQVMVNANTHISISGTFTNNGSLNAGSFENTIEYNGTTAQSVITPLNSQYYSLALTGPGNKTLPESSLNVKGDLTMSSPVTITGNTIEMNGSTPQKISGNNAALNSLTINNAQGVTLGNNASVAGALTLTNGLVTTTSTNILTVACNGTISNASASSYINGPLALIYCETGSKAFPIGKGGNYRPLTLEYTALNATSTVTAEQFDAVIPGSLPDAYTYTQNRHWTITQNGGSEFTYTLTLDGTGFNPGDGERIILKGDATITSLAASFATPYFTNTTGQTSFSNFAVASNCPAPTISTHPVAASTCEGTGAPQFTVAINQNYQVTYQWEVSPTGTGGTFSPITNDGVYSGATSTALTVTNPPFSMDGYAYRAVVTRSCGSTVTSNASVLTVHSIPTITLGTSPEVCRGTSAASLPFTATTGSPTVYSIDYEDAAITDVVDAALGSTPIGLTLPSNLAAGTYAGTLKVKNSTFSCESGGFPFTVTIVPLPDGFLSGNAICPGGTGQLTFTASAGTGPFTVVYNDGTADRKATGVTSGIPFNVFSNPASTTTYTLKTVSGAYCAASGGFSGETATITVGSAGSWLGGTSSLETDWATPGNWCGNVVPTSTTDVVIPSGLTFYPEISGTTAADCRNIQIQAGATLTILSDDSNSGSLIVHGNSTGTGTVIYKRWVQKKRWYIVSSPVSGAPIAPIVNTDYVAVISGTWDFAYYNEPTNKIVYYPTGSVPSSFTGGQGYYLRIKTDAPDNIQPYEGSLNTTNVTLPVTSSTSTRGWNAVGNPYTSAIKIKGDDGFIKLNAVTYDVLEADHAAVYLYNEGQYKIINNVGYTATPYQYPGMGVLGDSYVQAGQGFLVNVKWGCTDPNIRFTKGTSGLQAHDPSATTPLKSAEISWPGITLLAENSGQTAGAVVTFHENMTTGSDKTYDAGLFSTSGFKVFTRLVTDDKGVNFAIQALPDNRYSKLTIPVGVNLSTAGTVVFKAAGIVLPAGVYPVLDDIQQGKSTPLKTESDSYTATDVTSGTGRFYLRFECETKTTYFPDADGDGYGVAGATVEACEQPEGTADNNTDCNDNDASMHATFGFYADADRDGYGAGSLIQVCAVNADTPPAGYSVNNTDCNDADPAMHAIFGFYSDADRDGYGAGSLIQLCAVNADTPPVGYSFNNKDCNDAVASVNPGAAEICGDKIDNDCDGNVDEDCISCTYKTINANDFESSMGIWIDGGSNCNRVKSFPRSGRYSVMLRDNTNTSVMTTGNLDLTTYDELTLTFSYLTVGFDNAGEDFWLQISTDGGATFQTVEEWNLNDEFVNKSRNSGSVVISGPFAVNTRLRFRCDASEGKDQVYLDDIVISGCENTAKGTAAVKSARIPGAVSLAGDYGMKIYPNPFTREVNILITGAGEEKEANVAILDMAGRMLYNRKVSLLRLITLDDLVLPAGTYFVRVQLDTAVMTEKLVKTE